MQSAPQFPPVCLPQADETTAQLRKREDVAYQAMTVAAILLVLGSLWVF